METNLCRPTVLATSLKKIPFDLIIAELCSCFRKITFDEKNNNFNLELYSYHQRIISKSLRSALYAII